MIHSYVTSDQSLTPLMEFTQGSLKHYIACVPPSRTTLSVNIMNTLNSDDMSYKSNKTSLDSN